MKKIITALLLVSAFVTLAVNVVAQQTTLTNLPIYSEAQLRNYGLSVAKVGTRQTWADWGLDQPSTYAIDNAGAEAVLDALVSADLEVFTWDTNAMVSDEIMLYDLESIQHGFFNSIGFGYSRYAFGTNPKYHAVWMQDIPLLMIKNVTSAQVDALRPDGTVGNTYYQNVVNGHPRLNIWFAGKENGNLVLHYLDGSSTTNHLWKPRQVVSQPEPSGRAWKIAGHYVYRTAAPKYTIKIVEQNEDPSVYVELKNPTEVTFDVMGFYWDEYGMTASERPLAIEIDFVGGGHKTMHFNADRPTTIKFPKCALRAYFSWVNYDKGNTLYAGDYGGGGEKGIAVTPTE